MFWCVIRLAFLSVVSSMACGLCLQGGRKASAVRSRTLGKHWNIL
jgi:hypothetical protein